MLIAQTTPQPVPIHFITWANFKMFLHFFWLVSRAWWPVWALLFFFLLVKVVWLTTTRRRRLSR